MNVFVLRDGQQYGPYSSEQIQLYLQEKRFQPTDLAWYEGLPEWQPLQTLFPSAAPPTTGFPAPTAPAPTPTLAQPNLTAPAASSSAYPTTPSRKSQRSRTSNAPLETKSKAGLIWGLSLGGLVLLWLGATWFYGAGFKSYLESSAKESEFLAVTDYQSGLFSSRATTRLGEEDGEMDPEKGFYLAHEVAHGPISFTDSGVKLGTGLVTTKLDRERIPEPLLETLDEAFDEMPPFEFETFVDLAGNQNNRLNLARAEYSTDDLTLSFKGGAINFKSDRNWTDLEGDINLSPIEIDSDDFDLNTGVIEGTVEYNEKLFKIDLSPGDLNVKAIDESGETSIKVEAPALKGQFRQYSEEIPLPVGEGSFKIPSVSITAPGSGEMALQDFEISSLTRVDSGDTVESKVSYRIGKLVMDESGMAFNPFGDAITEGISIQIGSRGIDATLFAELSKQNNELYSSQFLAGFNGDIEALTTEEEMNEAAGEMMQLWLEMIQPGTELFAELSMGNSDLVLELNLGFGGEKSLTETETLRELVTALTGKLNLNASPKLLESPMTAMLVQQQAAGGMGEISDSGYAFEGSLKEGVVFIGDLPTPLLEMLGPLLDEPIDWEQILADMMKN